MKISSPSFKHNGTIPKKYTCDGGDINPELCIESMPAETKSLALIMDNPDVPRGTFVHWIVFNFNIDPKTSVIQEDSVPLGAFLSRTHRLRNERTTGDT